MVYIQTFTIPQGCAGRVKHETEHRAGLALLDWSLRREYGLEIREISSAVQKGKNGKPYLEGYPGIHFNISHSGNVAACALGPRPLGVDVEVIRQVKGPVIRRVLTKKEQGYLGQVPEGFRDREFFRFWTLKESYAKALGRGLSLDFTEAEFGLLPPVSTERGKAEEISGKAIPVKEEMQGWQFFQWIWREGEDEWVVSFCGRELSGIPGIYFCGQ